MKKLDSERRVGNVWWSVTMKDFHGEISKIDVLAAHVQAAMFRADSWLAPFNIQATGARELTTREIAIREYAQNAELPQQYIRASGGVIK